MANHRPNRATWSVATLAITLAALLPTGVARAGGLAYDVTGLGDSHANDGACTLREAILSANGGTTEDCGAGSVGEDGIYFAIDGTIVLGSPLPTIAGDLSIDATGRSIAISAPSTVDMLTVAAGRTLSLVNLTIANGRFGLINQAGTVHVRRTTFANLLRGIQNSGGTATIDRSSFRNNGGASLSAGAGISSSGSLTVTDSTFRNNDVAYHKGEGGALWVNGTTRIERSTFVGNHAGAYGGAVFAASSAVVIIANSTFAGNSAFSGGAIRAGGGTLTITNSTLSGNTVTGTGAGTALSVSYADVTLRNTLVAGITAAAGCARTSGASLSDGGGNLSWPDTSCPGVNADPRLWPTGLRGNGGPTATIALRWGSPAIDTADPTTCSLPPVSGVDQRGGLRPRDGDRSGSARCDIGAFEYAAVVPPVPVLVSATKVSGGQQLTWSRVRDALTYRVEVKKAGTVVASRTVTAASASVTIALGGGSYRWTVAACNALGCARSVSGGFSR